VRRDDRRRMAPQSVGNVRLDEQGKLHQGLLPAQIAGGDGDHRRQAGLLDMHLRSDHDLSQRDGHLDFARQVRIVEAVGVADALVRNEFQIFAAEGMAFAGGEVRERHLECAAHLGVHVMHPGRKAMG
jgi:hypothetical protein